MSTPANAPDSPNFDGAHLHRASFTGATFTRSRLNDATIRYSDLTGLTIRECDVDKLEIDSHDLFFGSLTVNGVDVVPLVDAELNRLFPGRELQKSTDPDGLRRGWEAVRQAWETTVSDVPADLRDASVRGEWSLAQTLRHLILATNSWLDAGIDGREQPFHPIGMPFAGYAESGGDMSIFREPTDFDEILRVRAEHQQKVTDRLATVTQEQLDEPRANPWDPDGEWKPTVGDCLRVILEEEWAHLRYVRRDIATLQTDRNG